jgi:hypothetical protein
MLRAELGPAHQKFFIVEMSYKYKLKCLIIINKILFVIIIRISHI